MAVKNHYALNLLGISLIVLIAYLLQDFIIPLIFAIILSVLIFPIVQFFEIKLKWNRILSISLSIIIFSIIVFAVFILIGIQFEDIMSKSSKYYVQIERKVTPMLRDLEQLLGVKSRDFVGGGDLKAKEIVKQNSSKILQFLTKSGGILGDFFLSPLYMFLFLLYRNFLVSFIYKITIGFTTKAKMRHILSQLYIVQQNYLLGLVSVMVIVGILNSIGLLILGIEFPFFFGFLCALLLLIPYIGIIIGSILPALIALATKDSYWYAVGVIGVFGFIQFLEGNFITPKITGSKVSLNAFVSILSIVLFSMLWGIPGMILALPITASLKVIFDNSRHMKGIGFLLGEANDKYFSTRVKTE
ncbi:AI-2E family transporter [Flavobacterium algicola]|uniref:AI-2E family transporter n=1 Tax=Flavobacterium algicola TaxID=556529 RepID=UPI001EFCED9D|nr:AI-2E family transporter [Flavobacterium algicola]MCG9790958.1 AI-2E family transporter [Flavobacterium algicola]